MSKCVLVMDMPSSCSKCKLKSRLNCEIEGVTHCCNLAEGMITLDKGFEERLPNCPLRELPEKITSWKGKSTNYQQGHRDGYNACIDELLKGSKLVEPEPCQPNCNNCDNNTDFDEVDNGCYMCCKGLENNYRPKGE